jgi:hypothetical protein
VDDSDQATDGHPVAASRVLLGDAKAARSSRGMLSKGTWLVSDGTCVQQWFATKTEAATMANGSGRPKTEAATKTTANEHLGPLMQLLAIGAWVANLSIS